MTATSVSATRTVAAPAADLFAVVADPRRHAEVDGSGMVVGDDVTGPITAVGEVFRMHVRHPRAGDYDTDNHVSRFEDGRLLAWRTAGVDKEPAGWEWSWRFDPLDDGATRVTLTCDWSAVDDPAVLERMSFPVVPQPDLERSLDRLAAAVVA